MYLTSSPKGREEALHQALGFRRLEAATLQKQTSRERKSTMASAMV